MDPSAPGWYPDPTGRHERRYWSGIRWSRHVDNGGERGDDPIEPDSKEHVAVQAPAAPALPEPPQLGIQQYQPSIVLAGVVAAALMAKMSMPDSGLELTDVLTPRSWPMSATSSSAATNR